MATVEEIISLTKRRGFIFPTSEIYGGIGGFYDFGPLGVELARNIKDLWWKSMVSDRLDVVGLDSSIIYNPQVWAASGHINSFTDPLVECKVCNERFRSDQPDEIAAHESQHQKAGVKVVSWTEPRQFNLLFKTYVGPVEDSKSLAYLRGETCQGIYINFNNIVATSRIKIPFGIAQIGKAFRNEVTPGKFLFRVREFEQMELEYFVHPTAADDALEYWKIERMKWLTGLGLSRDHLRLRQHEATERAHYAADSWDIEYNYPDWGFKELEGIANRTDFDLKTHSVHSQKDLNYTDPITRETYVPFIIEPSISVQRLMLAILFDSYRQEEKRVVLGLDPRLAPFKVAVFPLLANKPDLVSYAQKVFQTTKKHFVSTWDDRGNIGKRYLAQDEAGTPWCITIDFQTLEDDTVTLRERDTTQQIRLKSVEILSYIQNKLTGS